MLDEKDLQVLQTMMTQQKKDILAESMAAVEGITTEMEARILKQSAANTQVIIENAVNPQFQILAEAVQGINEHLDTLPTSEDLEITSSRIDTLEAIVKRLSRDVANLKKAQ